MKTEISTTLANEIRAYLQANYKGRRIFASDAMTTNSIYIKAEIQGDTKTLRISDHEPLLPEENSSYIYTDEFSLDMIQKYFPWVDAKEKHIITRTDIKKMVFTGEIKNSRYTWTVIRDKKEKEVYGDVMKVGSRYKITYNTGVTLTFKEREIRQIIGGEVMVKHTESDFY